MELCHVPLLLGSNSDEGLIKVTSTGYFPNSTNETVTLLKSEFPLLKDSAWMSYLSFILKGRSATIFITG